MNPEQLTLVDSAGKAVAELTVTSQEDGWYFGKIDSQQFPTDLGEALAWYDEVVEHQMLSFLDAALARVEQFGLTVRYANGILRKVFSLQISKANEVSFRSTPVPAPSWLAKSESA
jgi:hypothetical protein